MHGFNKACECYLNMFLIPSLHGVYRLPKDKYKLWTQAHIQYLNLNKVSLDLTKIFYNNAIYNILKISERKVHTF